jgi:hypothetical protein
MKRYILIAVLSLTGQYALAQISEGGEPMSFSLDTKMQEIPVLTMPPVNAEKLLQEDEKARIENEQIPFRFGYAIDVDIDIKKDGIQKQLSNGDKLWLLKIHSPNAFSVNLIFNRFRLCKGSKFFIYNEDRTMILGAFTPETSNNPYSEFATDLVQGNSIILEYYEPETSNDGIININKVIHGYINTFSDFSNGLGTSANCNIDVNCPIGNNWENEKRAVSMMLVNENTAFCTGCLVNNTQQDFTPYYLTANHCLGGNTNTWIFRFRYRRPSCNSGNPSNWVSIAGATLRANHAATDFALLELNTVPPANFDVYYGGWDRTATPAQNATAIHHPRGDAMKISYDANPAVAVSWVSGAQNHWRVIFEQGIVQHGSSGSPLFNQAHRIVGQLHGNQNNQCSSIDNTCHCNQTPIGEYGRFDISWAGGGTNSTRLSNWLDPNNTGVTVLDGIDACPTTVNFTNRIVTTNTTVKSCGDINLENVTVKNGAKLTLDAPGEVNIGNNFEVEEDAEFEIINN